VLITTHFAACEQRDRTEVAILAAGLDDEFLSTCNVDRGRLKRWLGLGRAHAHCNSSLHVHTLCRADVSPSFPLSVSLAPFCRPLSFARCLPLSLPLSLNFPPPMCLVWAAHTRQKGGAKMEGWRKEGAPSASSPSHRRALLFRSSTHCIDVHVHTHILMLIF